MSPELILLSLVFLVVYFFPTIVANLREANKTAAIFILNLFAGWTLIGWVGSLVWAVAADKKD